jgi:ABC-type multidrug transport system ATPase subunit
MWLQPIERLFKRGAPPARKALLKHVSITISPGEVAYVMGPSGAGKSTLLDVLVRLSPLGQRGGSTGVLTSGETGRRAGLRRAS